MNKLILIIVIYQLCILLYYSFEFLYKYFLVRERNLLERYGKDSYVMITGSSSGQGREFALKMAARGFNLFLIASERSRKLVTDIRAKYPTIKTILIVKDFRRAAETDFFDDIIEKIESISGNISILVNNVAHRTAWIPFHNMPRDLINDTIIVGTIVQSQLIRICIPYFLKRQSKSAIINITAQCIMPTFGFGEILSNEISVPFLSVYEAANAFGYYQANSILKEYSKNEKLDILNVMPGAVVTENTQYLNDTLFNIESDKYVDNIFRLIGNFQGNTYAHWGHAFSVFLINFAPFLKDPILYKTGHTIANDYMNTPKKKY
jgi:short-subunit dehydrogenase